MLSLLTTSQRCSRMLFILLCVWPTEALSVLQQNVGLNCYKMRTVSALSMAALPHFDRRTSPRQLVADGMMAFRQGKIQESIDLFDRADHAVPDGSLRPYLWQRGISYYYNDEFDKGSHQFRSDVAVNPLDVEEIVWDIACLSRLDPAHVPPSNMLSLPKGTKDRRRIMSTVYSLFRGEATEHDLAIAGHSGSKAEEFYALFYLGLFCESRGETAKAESYMKAAAATDYSNGSGDYMTDCARVHCKLREWR